jgi:hypothetical protein
VLLIALEPVDAATVTILVDNLTDAFMPNEGPARRFPFTAGKVAICPRRPASPLASLDHQSPTAPRAARPADPKLMARPGAAVLERDSGAIADAITIAIPRARARCSVSKGLNAYPPKRLGG